jgi:hypothetical protein
VRKKRIALLFFGGWAMGLAIGLIIRYLRGG